jgi:hypothetical protein
MGDSRMSDDWSGEERRTRLYDYEFRAVIREELQPIQQKQYEMREAQLKLEQKVTEWEMGAKWFRIFIIGTVSFITVAAGAWEWIRTHIK